MIRAFILGRLTAAPEMKETASGATVTKFSVASDRDFKRKDGTRDTDFVSCECWGGMAKYAGQYFTKGERVMIEADMQQHEWTDKDGGKHRDWTAKVNNLYHADGKKADAQAPASDWTELPPPPDDSDLPFDMDELPL